MTKDASHLRRICQAAGMARRPGAYLGLSPQTAALIGANLGGGAMIFGARVMSHDRDAVLVPREPPRARLAFSGYDETPF